MPKSEVWWTDPAGDSDDCVQADLTDTALTIWRHRKGNLTSVEIDRTVARDIAAWILTETRQTNSEQAP